MTEDDAMRRAIQDRAYIAESHKRLKAVSSMSWPFNNQDVIDRVEKEINMSYASDKFDKFIEGCQVLKANGAEISLVAEHDILYVSGAMSTPGQEALNELEECGFHYEEDIESWAYYT